MCATHDGRAKTSALFWLRSFVLHPHAPGLSHGPGLTLSWDVQKSPTPSARSLLVFRDRSISGPFQ